MPSDLPYQQAYNDPKKEKAYHRYLDGETQRRIATALKISPRTLANWSKQDGWEAERKARKIAASSEAVAAAAAAGAAEPETTAPTEDSRTETRLVGMERILGRQQRVTGRLVEAFEKDVERLFAQADTTGKPITRSAIAQAAMLGNTLLAMERKAWCVPDKIETKDTTPTPEDKVRKLTDDDLDRQLADAERAEAAAAARKAPAPSVN